MKRDMDLIREILIKLEEHEHGNAPRELEIEGYTDEQIYHHVFLLGQANLLMVRLCAPMGCPSPAAEALSMTWEGHDFLDAIRSDKTWDKTKRKITEAGGSMPFDIVKNIAIAIGMKQIGL